MKINHEFNNKNYYEILEVERNATSDDIKKSFKKLAKKYHPDLDKNNPHATANFQMLNKAYETLVDPYLRRKYDESLNNHENYDDSNFYDEQTTDYSYNDNLNWFEYIWQKLYNAKEAIKKVYIFSTKIEYFYILDDFYFLDGNNEYKNLRSQKPLKNCEEFYLSFFYDKNYKRHFTIFYKNEEIKGEIKRAIINRFRYEEQKSILKLANINCDRFSYNKKILYQLFDKPIKIKNENFINFNHNKRYNESQTNYRNYKQYTDFNYTKNEKTTETDDYWSFDEFMKNDRSSYKQKQDYSTYSRTKTKYEERYENTKKSNNDEEDIDFSDFYDNDIDFNEKNVKDKETFDSIYDYKNEKNDEIAIKILKFIGIAIFIVIYIILVIISSSDDGKK